MPPSPTDRERPRRRSLYADGYALLKETETVGTIFLIVVTALVCCLAVGPSLEIVLPLAVLAILYFASALYRRRNPRKPGSGA